jgi:Ca-activated chloride channel family protein
MPRTAIFFAVLLLFICPSLQAQTAHQWLLQADRAYRQGEKNTAKEYYQNALAADSSQGKAHYNLGNIWYEEKKYEEAQKFYRNAAEKSSTPTDKAKALNNLGNAYHQQKDYAQAVDAYKQSLRLEPNNMLTKQNLSRALKKMPPSMAQSQSESQQDNKQQEEQKKESEPQQQQKKDMESLMKIMENEDKKVQEKLRNQMKMPRKPTDKDW